MALTLLVKPADDVGVIATVLVILLTRLLEDPVDTLVVAIDALVVAIDMLVVSLMIAVGTDDAFVVAIIGLDANLNGSEKYDEALAAAETGAAEDSILMTPPIGAFGGARTSGLAFISVSAARITHPAKSSGWFAGLHNTIPSLAQASHLSLPPTKDINNIPSRYQSSH